MTYIKEVEFVDKIKYSCLTSVTCNKKLGKSEKYENIWDNKLTYQNYDNIINNYFNL